MSTRSAIRFIADEIAQGVDASNVSALCDRLAVIEAATSDKNDERVSCARWLRECLEEEIGT